MNRIEIVRPTWEQYFINIAEAVSLRSHDGETKVGAVIVDENQRIIASGYNGFPPGLNDDAIPNLRPDKYPYIVHAEINAIASAKGDLRGATLYTTISPCCECIKAIATAGITKIVYREKYLNDKFEFVEQFAEMCNIKFIRLEG